MVFQEARTNQRPYGSLGKSNKGGRDRYAEEKARFRPSVVSKTSPIRANLHEILAQTKIPCHDFACLSHAHSLLVTPVCGTVTVPLCHTGTRVNLFLTLTLPDWGRLMHWTLPVHGVFLLSLTVSAITHPSFDSLVA